MSHIYIFTELNGKIPTGYGNGVALDSYIDSFYTCPSNGIVLCNVGYGANAYAVVAVYDKNGNYFAGIGVSNGSTGVTSVSNTAFLPVFKGMKLKNAGKSHVSNGNENIVFTPLTYL